MTLVLLTLGLTVLAFFAGLRQLALAWREQQRVYDAVVPPDRSVPFLRWSALDRLLLATSWGRRIGAAVEQAGVDAGVGKFVTASAAASLAVAVALGKTLSWLLLPVGLAVGIQAARLYLRRGQTKRREAFIAQMPELARSLSNATAAGLSVRTAIAMAADELGDPAAAELRTVTEQLNLGASLETALTDLERRLPSREAAILISTLVVSARSGGGLVTALRDIAGTLETRKETRREIRTTYAQTVATAYTVLAMGVGVLFLLDSSNPGTVDTMLRHPLGQAALLIAGGIYTVGILTVRRMTRVEV